ncbi:MAG: hypothetical protein U1C56_02030 [Candidatus Curtissbacteria bacterium]|nr:hypothetical protein [Candidatus Curtissbacteria bacterium]
MIESKATPTSEQLDEKWKTRLFDASTFDWPLTDLNPKDLFNLVKDVVISRSKVGGTGEVSLRYQNGNIHVGYLPAIPESEYYESIWIETDKIDIEIRIKDGKLEIFKGAGEPKLTEVTPEESLMVANMVWAGHKNTPYR